MLTMTQLEALRTTLAAWNAANRRARREYARHPLAVYEAEQEAERKAAARRMRNARVRDEVR